MAKQTKQEQIEALEVELARVKRSELAFREHFLCCTRSREAPPEFTIGGTELRVVVHGITRAAGGVVVVHSGDFQDMPRLLDDVYSEWSRDCTAEFRKAAECLRIMRDKACDIYSEWCEHD